MVECSLQIGPRFLSLLDEVAATSHDLAQAQVLASFGRLRENKLRLNVEKLFYTRARGPLTHDIQIKGMVEMSETVQVHFTLDLKA